MSQENLKYVRIESANELRAWFLILFSDNILLSPIDAQEIFTHKLKSIDFMRMALERYYDCKFDCSELEFNLDFL